METRFDERVLAGAMRMEVCLYRIQDASRVITLLFVAIHRPKTRSHLGVADGGAVPQALRS